METFIMIAKMAGILAVACLFMNRLFYYMDGDYKKKRK